MCSYWPTFPSWRTERVTSCKAQQPPAMIDQCCISNDSCSFLPYMSTKKTALVFVSKLQNSFWPHLIKPQILLLCWYCLELRHVRFICSLFCNQFVLIWHKLRTHIHKLLIYVFYFKFLITLLNVSRFGANHYIHVLVLKTLLALQL